MRRLGAVRMTRRQRRRLLITSAIVLAVASVLSGLLVTNKFNTFQQQLTDIFFIQRAATPEPSKNVVIVAVDDKSLTELRANGRFFYWPRSFHADVVRQLVDARARTIVFDVLFDAPGEGDAALVDALDYAASKATFVVLGAVGDPLTHRATDSSRRESFTELLEPLPELRDLTQGIGLADTLTDPDGTVRRMPLVFDVGGQPVPSLSLMAVAKFLRRPRPWDAPIGNGVIPLAGREIPVDSQGAIIINYLGGPHKSAPPAFTVVSYVDVMKGRVPPETFERKLVLVGMTGTGYADDYWTPPSILGKMDGVEIHANTIDTILRTEYIRELPRWVDLVLIWAFAIVAGATLIALPMLVGATASALGIGAFMVGTSYSFDENGTIVNLVYPPLAMFLTYGCVLLYRVIFEQGETRALRGVLGRYLSPSVVTHVTRDPDQLKLGGDQREMTVLFSDLRGFTTFSETLDPETLVHTLNEYLTAMSDVIFEYEGTIDKYMGDAVMAFWNAPQDQPNHAEHAVRAALGMMTELKRLNEEWGVAGRYPLDMGIGINTGIMKVGNMGSASRFDYTVLGDSVNLGSRLEGLNKEYGTNLIVSAATLAETKGAFRSRFLDLVAVKGKKEPVEVHEIVSAEARLDDATESLLRAYEAGVTAYRGRDWLGAAARFQEALRYVPNDGPSGVYLERCETLMADPPPADWDGVYVMTRK